MKLLVVILLVLVTNMSLAQRHNVNFSSIDHRVSNIEADNLDTLAQRLTVSYSTDLQKVRAIFRWISYNIAYKTSVYKRPVPLKSLYVEQENDDTGLLKSLDVRVAESVLQKREAVCDGYARLFKALCDVAGIRSEIIVGFARGNIRAGVKFRSNHSWNAVFIDNSWQLLDVTWASGFINFGGEFVRHFDENYFLTPPSQFIQDHFPEDLHWTLLADPPIVKEFHQSPFRHSAFLKHHIISYKPSDGIIEASVGDKLQFELETDEAGNNLMVASGSMPDSSLLSILWLTAKPNAITKGNRISCTFTVEDEAEKWLNIIYKGDVVLRYKLRVKKDMAIK